MEAGVTEINPFGANHSHCQMCIKILKCSVRPRSGESCEIISCDLECGARFHTCKRDEHRLLCANEKVPCINSVNGCPVLMLRKHISQHLETCPASVVHCTMEWNRWPVHVCDRQLTRQPHQPLNETQLDVALALRDQRMLKQLWHAPRRTRRALRNSLTQKYPPVPLNPCKGSYESEQLESNYTSRTVSDDESDTPWEVRKTPPGLESSVCGQLYRASRHASETLTAALAMINNHTGHNQEAKGESLCKETPDEMCLGHDEQCHLDGEDKENVNSNVFQHCKCEKMDVDSCNNESKVTLDLLPAGNCDAASQLCMNGRNSEGRQSECHSINLSSNSEPNCCCDSCDMLFVDNALVSDISSSSVTTHSHPISYHGLSSADSAYQQSAVSSNPPLAPPPPFVSLGLDLNLESITRYQAKPKSMYTFLCAQEFRRDEYAWHYKNVHSDIHGGLNGWLEQRCPLAQYGCVFSRKRFLPIPKGSVIIHNDILESFGVQPPYPQHISATHDRQLNKKSSRRSPGRIDKPPFHRGGSMDVIHEYDNSSEDRECQKDQENCSSVVSLTQLPFEVLRHIARYLDGFSLSNLALTCCLLREVCCSLLDERGVVVLQWERRRINEKYSWHVAYKRWFFSTAFTPIEKWCFSDDSSMSNHLQICRFFHRNVKTFPYFYPMGAEPNMHIYLKMKNSIINNASSDNADPASVTKL